MKKRGFYQPVVKYEKQANILTRTSAKSSSVLKKKKTKKKQQQNLTFISELHERKKDTYSDNKNQLEINEREVTNYIEYVSFALQQISPVYSFCFH